MRLRHSLCAVLTSAAVALALAGTADASVHRAHHVQPKLGVWEAAPKGVDSYTVGGWTLGKVNGHLHMTSHPDFNAIYYPNADKCGGILTPPLSKTDYRLGSKGRFTIKDKEANQTVHGKPLVQHVVWNGTFTHKKAVSGTISIWVAKAPAPRGTAKPKVVCRDMRRHWSGQLTVPAR